MNERPTATVPPEIEEAQLQFENWRRGRNRGQRIPENLWGTAVELAKQHGVWPTARALKLDYNRLKRRVGNGDDSQRRVRRTDSARADALHMRRGDGRCARRADAHRTERAAADVTALSRTFWSEGE